MLQLALQAGLALALLGGVQKPGSTLGAPGHPGAIHVLLCGAPGMSQSPLLEVGLQAAFHCWTSHGFLIRCLSEGFPTLWDLIEKCKGMYRILPDTGCHRHITLCMDCPQGSPCQEA